MPDSANIATTFTPTSLVKANATRLYLSEFFATILNKKAEEHRTLLRLVSTRSRGTGRVRDSAMKHVTDLRLVAELVLVDLDHAAFLLLGWHRFLVDVELVVPFT